VVLLSHLQEFEGAGDAVAVINQLGQGSLGFGEKEFARLWTSIGDLIGSGSVGACELVPLLETAVVIGSNNGLSSNQRILPVTALVNGMDYFREHLDSVMRLQFDVLAQSIEETSSLAFDELELTEKLFSVLPRVDAYPLFMAKVLEAINGGNPSHAAAGFLFLRVLFAEAPDCVHTDVKAIVDLLQSAIVSRVPIVIQAACAVVESFEESFGSLNVFGLSLLESLVPLLTLPSSEVRDHAYKALLHLCDMIDCKVPDFYRAIRAISPSVPDGDLVLYMTALAYSVQLAPELDDDDIDGLLTLIEKACSSVETAAPCLAVAHALAERDSDQLDDVMRLVSPTIGPLLASEDSEAIQMTLSFLNDMLRSSFLPAGFLSAADLMRFALGEEERTKLPAVLACSHLSVLETSLDPQLFETVATGLDSDGSSIQGTAIEAVSILNVVLSDEQRTRCFDRLAAITSEGIDVATIKTAIHGISLIVVTDQTKIDAAISLINRMISGDVAFLGGLSLSQVDTAMGLLHEVCGLISNIVLPGTPIPVPVIEFLLEFLQRPSELDKCPAVEALSDLVLRDAVTSEARELIIGAVVAQIPGATDPPLQANIIYLLNVLVMRDRVFIAPIIGLLETLANWWSMGLSHRSGYQDVIENLSSLFLAMAIYSPDFPANLLVQVFDQFPSEESDQTGAMCENLLLFMRARPVPEEPLVRSIGLSLGRIFGNDRQHLMQMRIDDDLLGRLRQLCLMLLDELPTLATEIAHAAGKSKTRSSRVAAILQH
jgi:uncharacterized protein YaaQ